MDKKQILCFLQSLVFLPIITTTFPITPQTIQIMEPQDAIEQINNARTEETILTERAQKIDAYFEARNLPLAGHGRKMAEVALEYDLDWRLIPAIAMRESTGGKFACQSVDNNPFGWHSCRAGFESMDEAIESLGRHISGNNKSTQYLYAGKSTTEILKTYNPPSVIPKYADQVIAIMNTISPDEESIG